jgi:pSer/pThr/pTyr-binding forkhead associated (FHA) protein
MILEITAGPAAGKQIQLVTNEAVVIGRAQGRVQFAIPDDNYMSGVHFSVELNNNVCRIRDLKSSNGTFLNGTKIQETLLANGDEIRAGNSAFVVRMVRDAQLSSTFVPGFEDQNADIPLAARSSQAPQQSAPFRGEANLPRASAATPVAQSATPTTPESAKAAAPARAAAPSSKNFPTPSGLSRSWPPVLLPQPKTLQCGPWKFAFVPEGWEAKPDFGLQLSSETQFPSSIAASEERLGSGITLTQYVEAQTKILRQYLTEPHIEPANAHKVEGAAESLCVEVRYRTRDGADFYSQRVYVKNGVSAGTIVLTTLEKDVSKVLPIFQSVVGAARYSPES